MGDTRERDERNSSKDRRRGRERVGKRKGKEDICKLISTLNSTLVTPMVLLDLTTQQTKFSIECP